MGMTILMIVLLEIVLLGAVNVILKVLLRREQVGVVAGTVLSDTVQVLAIKLVEVMSEGSVKTILGVCPSGLPIVIVNV